jgi:hypothetical protein
MAWLLGTYQILKEIAPLTWLIFLIVNRSSETIINVQKGTDKATKLQRYKLTN